MLRYSPGPSSSRTWDQCGHSRSGAYTLAVPMAAKQVGRTNNTEVQRMVIRRLVLGVLALTLGCGQEGLPEAAPVPEVSAEGDFVLEHVLRVGGEHTGVSLQVSSERDPPSIDSRGRVAVTEIGRS